MNPKESALYEAVGRFITSYAGAEAGVHMIARKLSRLDDEVARAIFKGLRLVDMIDRINALLRIVPEDGSGRPLADDAAIIVQACLTQLDLVSKRRHSLVHRVTVCGDKGIFITSILNSKSLDSAEYEHYTLTELRAMTEDCNDIFNQLDRLAADNRVKDALKVGVPAWRYKPPPPKPKNSQRRANPK